MEIRIYNQDLDLQGIIENATSLLWCRKYFEPGTFELHTPITNFNISLLKIGNLVTMYGQDEAGIIEDVVYEEENVKNAITAQGRFLSAYMGRRIIKGTVNLNCTIEMAMRTLIEGVTPIPRLVFGELKGYEETIQGQVTYKNLLTFMGKLARAGNIGYRFRPDFNKKKMIYENYVGIDRSTSQGNNNRVIFSESYDNLNKVNYHANDQMYANVAYVIGKDKNDNSVLEIVGENSITGLDRREIYVDASGVNAADLTGEEFLSALQQEGLNTLNENVFSETFECDTNAEGNFVYRRNYDLGDIVTVKKASWKMQRDLRITELQETYEYGTMTVSPTLGDPLPETMNWED